VTQLDNDPRIGILGSCVDIRIVITDYCLEVIVSQFQRGKELLATQIVLSITQPVMGDIMRLVINAIDDWDLTIVFLNGHILSINQQYSLKLLTIPPRHINAGW
jgi:hypothetical protein